MPERPGRQEALATISSSMRRFPRIDELHRRASVLLVLVDVPREGWGIEVTEWYEEAHARVIDGGQVLEEKELDESIEALED